MVTAPGLLPGQTETGGHLVCGAKPLVLAKREGCDSVRTDTECRSFVVLRVSAYLWLSLTLRELTTLLGGVREPAK